jgi:putative oxidoreductase
MNASLALFGRIGLSLIFIISGWGKIAAYAGTQQYMESAGLPGALLPLVIALELGGGLAILTGAFTRWIALAMAAFSLVSAVVFHAHFDDAAQAINFWKNMAMAGGFLTLAAHGAGRLSLDHLWNKRRNA